MESVSSLRNHPPPSEPALSPNRIFPAVLLAVWFAASACSGEPPEVPIGTDGQADEVLVLGRSVYGARCANCHGAEGDGGTGPKVSNGEATVSYPVVQDQIEVVTNGSRGMPAFGVRLSEDEIVAVVRYTREVLSQP